MGLALAADLRVASESTRLVPGYLAIGASPDGGVSYALTRALGAARALSLIVRNQALRAEELGASVDCLRTVGVGRIDELPLETARLLAGVILLSAVGQRGDALVQVPPSPSRLIGVQIALSELPYMLAPREAYQAMQQAQLRRDAVAEHYAHGGDPNGAFAGPEV